MRFSKKGILLLLLIISLFANLYQFSVNYENKNRNLAMMNHQFGRFFKYVHEYTYEFEKLTLEHHENVQILQAHNNYLHEVLLLYMRDGEQFSPALTSSMKNISSYLEDLTEYLSTVNIEMTDENLLSSIHEELRGLLLIYNDFLLQAAEDKQKNRLIKNEGELSGKINTKLELLRDLRSKL